ncbi:MAG: hypothetical protein KGQ68_05360, partial [Gammaproteobacteria bacterium]|nr:hypothetical protein [Gammaproteobacteria bacterium]
MPSKKKHADKAPEAVAQLWGQGYFKGWIIQDEIAVELNKRGKNFPANTLRMALSRASFLIRQKRGGHTEYIQKKPAISKELNNIESALFDSALHK